MIILVPSKSILCPVTWWWYVISSLFFVDFSICFLYFSWHQFLCWLFRLLSVAVVGPTYLFEHIAQGTIHYISSVSLFNLSPFLYIYVYYVYINIMYYVLCPAYQQ